MKKTLLLSLLTASILSSDEDLFNLSLEELINIEVTTSSKEKETLQETPAIVSVLTSKQIEDLGVQNVYEALSFLPGIVINENYFGYTVVSFRGVLPGVFNNKALFMIDSHPVYEGLFGSGHLEYLPLEMIDKIEVVRSPASSLYGNQAISGVVNIITKKGEDNFNSVTARAGSHDHYYTNANFHSKNVSFSTSIQRDRGYNYNGTLDEFSNPVNLNYHNDLENIFLNIHDETWHAEAAYFKHDEARFGMNPWVWMNGNNIHESLYVDLQKSFKIDTGTLEVTLRYDENKKQLLGAEFPFPANIQPALNGGKSSTLSTMNNKTKRYSGNMSYKDKIADLSYIVGTAFEYDETTAMRFTYDIDGTTNPNGGFLKPYDAENYSAFTQLKYKYSDKLSTIFGLRVEHNTDSGRSDPIPRLGITYKTGENSYIKALYAEAFRSAVFIEKHTNVPSILFGDPKLKREQSKTYELAYDTKIDSTSTLQLALYYLKLKNVITRVPATGTALQQANSGLEMYMYGIEADYNKIINESTSIAINSSYKNGKDKLLSTTEDAPFVANFTFNTSLSYAINPQWRTTVSDQYVGSKDYILSSGATGKIDAYNLVNLTLVYDKHPFKGSLALKNIFNEKYTYPEFVRKNIKELPGGDTSSAYLTLQYSF